MVLLQVQPTGNNVFYLGGSLEDESKEELRWAWESIGAATCCCTLVALHSGVCILQAGLVCPGCKPGEASAGIICKDVMQRGQANYLANLALYPGAPLLPIGQFANCSQTIAVM
jgi:hypothetical protein